MRRILSCIAIAGLTVGSVMGCKSKSAERQETAAPQAQSAPLDPETVGTVSGTIHFSGEPPERVKIDMSMDPVCSMMGGENDAEQYVVNDGKLANVYVYVKSGPPMAMGYVGPMPAPVVLDQKGCRYTPHVIAIPRGGTVEFRNSDSTMHNIHTMPTVVGNETVDISQGPKGAPQTKQFRQPEVMIPVRCNNHPWMNAFINVSSTPFFAVTGADGKFEIRGLPAGTYTLAAVHEKMGEQTMTVTVAPKQTATADFTYAMKK
jgi:plastocyanin